MLKKKWKSEKKYIDSEKVKKLKKCNGKKILVENIEEKNINSGKNSGKKSYLKNKHSGKENRVKKEW